MHTKLSPMHVHHWQRFVAVWRLSPLSDDMLHRISMHGPMCEKGQVFTEALRPVSLSCARGWVRVLSLTCVIEVADLICNLYGIHISIHACPVANAGVAPALVVLGQYDIVHDEGLKYAEKLTAAGVSVTCKDYDGVAHNFPSYSVVAEQKGLRIRKGEAAIKAIVAAFNTAWQ